jgi:hypothetical protein
MAEEQTIPPAPTHDISIVLVGAMNPRIHHPLWYKYQGLITEEEFEQAMRSFMTVSPQMAQFGFSGIHISCVADRWDIKANDITKRQRMLDLTIEVFDKRLPQTPIGIFAFNNDFVRTTNISDVSASLGKGISERCFGLSESNVKSAYAMFTMEPSGAGPVNVKVEHGPNPQDVIVRVNSNHSPSLGMGGGDVGNFDLAPLLKDRFDADFKMAERLVKAVVDGLERLRG